VEVTTVYIGSFEDVTLGKEAALAQASAGVDVIFHIADAAGVGVVQACEEAGIWAIGWGLDQNHLAPDTVLSSLLFSGAELLLQDVQMVVDGTWTGEVRLYGLETGVVGIADYHGLVPDDVASQVEAVKQQIISGEIEVPYIEEASE
jgi:basic membrane protein A